MKGRTNAGHIAGPDQLALFRRGSNGFGIDFDFNFVAYGWNAGFQQIIVSDPVILAIQLCFRFESNSRGALGILDRLAQRDRQSQFLRDAAHRKVRDHEEVVSGLLDPPGLKVNGGVVRGVEEIRASQMIVPLGYASSDALDLNRRSRFFQCLTVEDEGAGEFSEDAFDAVDPKMPGGESYAGVGGVDGVGVRSVRLQGHEGSRRHGDEHGPVFHITCRVGVQCG